jgi:hypothetical protein
MADAVLVLGWAVTVAIAIGGWLVSQRQARRATRSNMRINYLLDAYRRLAKASNRPLDATSASDIEAAISDIFLLGTPTQARLAAELGRAFADSGNADAKDLLMDLRTSLRDELQLGSLLATDYLALRITPDGDTAADHARIWHETSKETWAALSSGSDHPREALTNGDVVTELTELATKLPPSGAIAASTRLVEQALRGLVTSATTEDLSDLNLAQLAHRALELKLIDAQLADSLNGLSVMRLMAAMDQDQVNQARAMEFTSLATALLYLLRRAGAKQ